MSYTPMVVLLVGALLALMLGIERVAHSNTRTPRWERECYALLVLLGLAGVVMVVGVAVVSRYLWGTYFLF